MEVVVFVEVKCGRRGFQGKSFIIKFVEFFLEDRWRRLRCLCLVFFFFGRQGGCLLFQVEFLFWGFFLQFFLRMLVRREINVKIFFGNFGVGTGDIVEFFQVAGAVRIVEIWAYVTGKFLQRAIEDGRKKQSGSGIDKRNSFGKRSGNC